MGDTLGEKLGGTIGRESGQESVRESAREDMIESGREFGRYWQTKPLPLIIQNCTVKYEQKTISSHSLVHVFPSTFCYTWLIPSAWHLKQVNSMVTHAIKGCNKQMPILSCSCPKVPVSFQSPDWPPEPSWGTLPKFINMWPLTKKSGIPRILNIAVKLDRRSPIGSNLFSYQARESSLVPAGFLTAQFLQKT